MPRQGTQDDGDVGGERGVIEVPPSLRSSVAFLSDEIQVYESDRPTVQTSVRVYLGNNGLVSQFRVETIFSEVLHKLTPRLPAPIEGPHFQLLRDILGWAIRLMTNVVARGRGADAMYKLLRTIPVPCEGGWYPMAEATFGEGWPDVVGETLKRYLKVVRSSTARDALQRVLLSPGHNAWGGIGPAEMHLLTAGGVLDGLRLFETTTKSWQSGFRASLTDLRLPSQPPSSISNEHWSEFVACAATEAKAPFVTPQPYEVGSIFTFPGMAEFSILSEEARSALSELILQSLPSWSLGLEPLSLSKQGGQWSKLQVTSPLKHFLRTAPWMAIREAKGFTWARPSERWFVPADTLAGRSRHYAHLRALPATMARHIGQRPDLAAALRVLEMPFFDPDATSASPRLIEALTASVGSDEVSDQNVLLGQLREAWQRFRPSAGQSPITHLAVRLRDRRLSAMMPTLESPAYLPDSAAYVAELEDFGFPVVAIGTSDARDLREWFKTAYGARIQLTSALSLLAHVDEKPWIGAGAVALADSDLNWLIRPLLVMVATQSRGVHSAAFKERLATLQAARVDWVANLKVAVMRDATRLAMTDVAALWEPQRRTLVITEYCRTHLDEISGALSQALEREDLELPLRYALRAVGSVDNAPEDAAAFLAPLRITAEQVYQVLEHLRGDVGHTSRLVSILVFVLSPQDNVTALKEADSEEDLAAAITALALPGLVVSDVLQAARDSHDVFEFGRAVSPHLGEAAALPRWNTELAKLGQPPIANRNWSIQLQACLEEAAALVKRIIAHAIRNGSAYTYPEMWGQYHGLLAGHDLSRSHWIVEFNDAMYLVAGVVESWVSDQALLAALREAVSVETLRKRLSELGLMLEVDPDECARKNHELIDHVARGIDRLRLAVWLRTATGHEGDWQPLIDLYRSLAKTALSREAFTREWSEVEAFALLKVGVVYGAMSEFEAALHGSIDLASLRAFLEVSSEELANAENRLEALKAERTRRRSFINVCGEDFDSSEENLEQLWGFLSARISDTNLAKGMPLDLAKPTALSPITTKGKGKNEAPRVPSKKPQRQTKAVEELIGLAGEIHVFRILRQKYGEEAVPSSAWISENSRRVFPFNESDDGKGCDFAFTAEGKQFRIEVKASAGEDETFTLGSSEIRLAMDIATKAKRRREIFVLVHVKNTLSDQPLAVVLPNPYDPKYTGMFSVEEADARVRYRARG